MELPETPITPAAIPALVALVTRFDERAAHRVAYADLLTSVESVISAVDYFALDAWKARDATLVELGRELGDSSREGFRAVAQYILVQHIAAHPELLQLAAERAQAQLWQALTVGIPKE